MVVQNVQRASELPMARGYLVSLIRSIFYGMMPEWLMWLHFLHPGRLGFESWYNHFLIIGGEPHTYSVDFWWTPDNYLKVHMDSRYTPVQVMLEFLDSKWIPH